MKLIQITRMLPPHITDISNTLSANDPTRALGNYNPITVIKDERMERIRKLTPCECWRLQGFSKITKTDTGYEFDDTLFKRAESVNSNTQLYKQAGNSITVDVLEGILTNLFIDTTQKEDIQLTLF